MGFPPPVPSLVHWTVMNETTDTDTLTREKVLQVLGTVFDPEIPVNIWDLGLIYDLQIAGNDVSIKMTLTAVGCPIGPAIAGEIATQLQPFRPERVTVD